MKNLNKLTTEVLKENPQKVDVAAVFIWFHYATKSSDADVNQINEYFRMSDLPIYNPTYLREALRKSVKVTKGSLPKTYKPQRKFSEEMADRFPFVVERGEEVIVDDIIIPNALVENTRGYILHLSQQINACYVHNIFDGCAVLMRRLLEVLLIHCCESANKISDITEGDGYKSLSAIINYTISTKPFKLSKDIIDTLDDFRQIGNFSAHKIHYNAKRRDIDNIRLKFRLTVEELLYLSGLKK